MKVGDLVKYSSEWLEESFYHEAEVMDLAGIGIVIEIKTAWAENAKVFDLQEALYLVKWTKGKNDTWQYSSELEVISESK